MWVEKDKIFFGCSINGTQILFEEAFEVILLFFCKELEVLTKNMTDFDVFCKILG